MRITGASGPSDFLVGRHRPVERGQRYREIGVRASRTSEVHPIELLDYDLGLSGAAVRAGSRYPQAKRAFDISETEDDFSEHLPLHDVYRSEHYEGGERKQVSWSLEADPYRGPRWVGYRSRLKG